MSGTIYCRGCGAQINAMAPLCPQCGAPQGQGTIRIDHPGDGIPRDFANSVQLCFQKYANARGRAPRAEYWYFALFSLLANLVAYLIVGVVHVTLHVTPFILPFLLSLLLLSPSICVSIRRLHDRDMSGWWFLPIVILDVVSLIGRAASGFSAESFQHPWSDAPALVLVMVLAALWGIVMFVLFCMRGTMGDNHYGPENGQIDRRY